MKQVVYAFIFYLLLSSLSPAFSVGETVWEDETLKICVSHKPIKEEVSVLDDALAKEADEKGGTSAQFLCFDDTQTKSRFTGMIIRGVFHLHQFSGDDFSGLAHIGPHLNSHECNRAVVNVSPESQIFEDLKKVGFIEVASIEEHNGKKRVTLTRDYNDGDASRLKPTQDQINPADLKGFIELVTLKKKKLSVMLHDKTKNDEVVGGAYVHVFSDVEADGNAELIYLWIKGDPKFRGKGLGKRIMSWVESEVKKYQSKKLSLFTDGFYSWSFYPPLGFRTIAEIPNYSRNDKGQWFNAYMLEKDLAIE